MKSWRKGFIAGLGLTMLVAIPGISQGESVTPRASLSWDPTERVTNLPGAPEEPIGLYIQIEGLNGPASIEYRIQYAAPIGAAVSFSVLKADSAFHPECFRPAGCDTTLLGGTLEGPGPAFNDSAAIAPFVLLKFAVNQETPAMRFRLSRVIARTADGAALKPVVTDSDVTIRDGFGVQMPPHIRTAQLLRDDILSTVDDPWVRVVAEDLEPGWTLSLGDPDASWYAPDTLRIHEPNILARFNGTASQYEDQWVLLANPDGRTSGLRIREVAGVPGCVFEVGKDCATIQECIDLAWDGCRIDIPPGTYTENLTLDKNITLFGDVGNPPTIDGQGAKVIDVTAPLIDADIYYVNLVGGSDAGGGGAAELDPGNEVILGECEIAGNSAVSPAHQKGWGGGILDEGNGSNWYVFVDFTENESSLGGGGLAIVPEDISLPTYALVQKCVFTDNVADPLSNNRRQGGQAFFERTQAQVLDCQFVADLPESTQSAAFEGGALYLDGCDDFEVSGGQFIGNQVLGEDIDYGLGGAILLDNSTGGIDGVVFVANRAQWAGGAVYARDCPSVAITNCFFDPGNTAGLEENTLTGLPRIRGGAVAISNSGGEINRNVFTANQVVDSFQLEDPDLLGGALFVGNLPGTALLDIENNTFVENAAVADINYPALAVGGIYLENILQDVVPDVYFHNNILALTASEDPAFYCKGDWSEELPDGHFGCNDLWNNDGGNTGGDPDHCIVIGENFDFSLDPLFCSCGWIEYCLAQDSPCRPDNHPEGPEFCGLIGALDDPCLSTGVPEEEDPHAPGTVERFEIGNTVGPGRISMSKPLTASRIVWSLYDPGGRLTASGELPKEPGKYTLDLLSASRGGGLASGLYFMRLSGTGVDLTRRVTVIR
ncbi:MAG: hypothetical protein GF355_13345 [Candidatus Eisenbacteria bacterium]|nr:hypothetical protein [Candidatus Eisenbacteria bacterium]